MNCDQARTLIGPYADGELDVARILELEPHLRDCRACALEWRNLQSLKKTLKKDALYSSAPAELRRSLAAELRAQVGGEPERKSPARTWNWNWLTTATTGFAAACFAILLIVTLNRPSSRQLFAQEIVSSHVRSLMADHAVDVVSTDQHTVKPWFDGKLDFAPPVKDLSAQAYVLKGGRLDYLGGHAVAALVYQSNKHPINLFIWPAKDADSKPVATAPLQGYNLVHWTKAGMNFWAVSDLNEKGLLDFAEAYGP